MITARPPDQRVLIPEVRGASSEIISVNHLDEIRGPHPHNSALEPRFSPPTRKDEVLVNKFTSKGTLVNRLPHRHVFSTDHDTLLTFWNSQLCNKCNWRPVVSHILRWDLDRTAHNLRTEGAGRLLLLLFLVFI